MQELVDAKHPFRATHEDGRSCILIPLRAGYPMDVIMIQYPDGKDGNGKRAIVDEDDFQLMDWEPIDLPEEQWKHLLPQKK